MIRGTYCLVLNIRMPVKIRVGSLGKLQLRKGIYVYVGSALNGIETRIARHFRRRKKRFWHIDYLTTRRDISIEAAYYLGSGKREECSVADALLDIAEPVKKFGCSDCSCKSHLFRVPERRKLKLFLRKNSMKPFSAKP